MAFKEAYDFVIVGGGTAGLVVANRLSEDPSVDVLVIEAGRNEIGNPQIHVPGNWVSLIGSEFDWKFDIVPQVGLYDRNPSQPAGRVLGGSSAINGLTFIAPSKATVDAWGKLGNAEWSWDKLAPYFRKSHNLAIPDAAVRKHLGLEYLDGSAGDSGPLHLYYATPLSEPLAQAWTETFKNLGYEMKHDPASGAGTGGFNSIASIDGTTKERAYSAVAYWKPASTRSNLHLMAETMVEKLHLEGHGENVVVKGIDVSSKGERRKIAVSREAILAAGTYGSPQILELSGIGNPKILERFKIPTVVSNEGVGENLQDHLMTGISYEVEDNVETLDAIRARDPAALQAASELYEKDKTGPLSWGGINYFSYMPVANEQVMEGTKPFATTLDKFSNALDTKGNKGLEKQYEYIKSVLQSRTEASGGVYLSPRGTTYGISSKASDYGISSLPGKYVTLGLSLLLPFSRGSSHIASADPKTKPRIDPRYLSNPLDVEVAASHLEFIEKVAQTKPMVDLLKPKGRRNSQLARGDDREMAREWTRRSVLSNWHPCGTCSMMPREMGGVVNERLLVYGLKNLRVVDASVMPIIPRGQIQSSVYMVAERAADLIKEDHGMKVEKP